MSDATERLIDGLVADLAPVRPLPRMRSAFAVIVALWAGLLGALAWRQTTLTGGVAAVGWLMDRVYLVAFVALIVAALGGTVSALASGTPGRERLELGGLGAACSGLFAGAIVCVVGMLGGPGTAALVAGTREGMCLGESALLSLLPAGVILAFLVRGWAMRPWRAAGIALLASGALGASIVHFGCGFLEPGHVLLSHLSVPLVLVVLGLYPLGLLLARRTG
ncbi:MAG: NrsF family protein [Myxococcota bacterium]